MTTPRVAVALEVDADAMPLPPDELASQVERALAAAGFDGRLSLAVLDDDAMRRVNRDYHDRDEPTDVLAFPLTDTEGAAGPGFDAEVVVSLDTALREAAERGVEPEAELLLYVVHGVLHLMGEDDHEPDAARRMHERTLGILEGLGHRNAIEAAPGSEA